MRRRVRDVPAFGCPRLTFALIEQPAEIGTNVIMWQYEYPDLQFFGGRVLANESPSMALGRILSWQLPGLRIPAGAYSPLWQGMCAWKEAPGSQQEAQPTPLEEVTVFGVFLPSDAEFFAACPGAAVTVPKNLQAIHSEKNLEPFALNFLIRYVNNTGMGS